MKTWHCQHCDLSYAYELPVCSFCGGELNLIEAPEAMVLAVTEVNSPPLGHENVPYWTALLEAKDHSKTLYKSDVPLVTKEVVLFGDQHMEERLTVGILGCGIMGSGLAEHLLAHGHPVIWYARNDEKLEKARQRVMNRLGRTLDASDVEHASERLKTTGALEDLAPSDMVIEAIAEEMSAKLVLLSDVEPFVRDDVVIATNTSGLSIDDLSCALTHPERFGALHFFNPVPRMRLVETAVGSATSPEVSAFLDDFARSLGKTPVRVSATPAFAVNRALMPLINEAIRELEEGVADAESIDQAITLGLNHPMGPLALADLIGLDVCEKIMRNLAERLGDKTYLPRPLLVQLVAEGNLGRKTGQGFYQHTTRPVSG